MAPLNHLCLVITIFLSVSALSPSPTVAVIPRVPSPKVKIPSPAASSKLVVQLCSGKSIMNRRFCLKALSNPQAAAARDWNQLTNVVMKLAVSNAEATLNVIKETVKKPGGSSQSLKALQTCLDVYKYAIQSFGMIFTELSEDPMTANYDATVIGPEADNCERALATANIQAPRISSGNRCLHYYSSMGGEITAIVEITAFR
ncbi:uncharacterized protein LOC111300131 [Durio zibethinus]|uniref:Uncharacterized protein LOC111300131 n=1 Tax=Durio zibethinus TaxID=66656 RepID=A0A6P5ZGP4_DURZI|nr:uncharacterized protein LOC111300131 [Durio zibethinus]